MKPPTVWADHSPSVSILHLVYRAPKCSSHYTAVTRLHAYLPYKTVGTLSVFILVTLQSLAQGLVHRGCSINIMTIAN